VGLGASDFGRKTEFSFELCLEEDKKTATWSVKLYRSPACNKGKRHIDNVFFIKNNLYDCECRYQIDS